MIVALQPLRDAIRANCAVSDARHAGGMTLCNYLMEARELFRWERGIAPTATLPREEVGAWLTERERLWATLEETDYRALPLVDDLVDPFDVDRINAALVPQRLVYGAGIGRYGKPQFFLGDLAHEERRDGTRILVSGREHARDLAPAPAATRGGTIWLRTESLRRVLWERVEPWLIAQRQGAWRTVLDAYGFATDAEAALERMTRVERETLLLHELGEVAAGRRLGADWEALLGRLSSRRAEAFARAARDHLADCLVTLPVLLEQGSMASLHSWGAALDGMRRAVFPRAVAAHAAWIGGDDGRALADAAAVGALHWRAVCERLLALHRGGEAAIDAAIDALADDPAMRL